MSTEPHRRSPDDGFHVGYHRFVTHADYTALTEALGYGNDRDEPAAEPRDIVEPLTAAMSDAHDHFGCPEWCDECSQWEAPLSCERCHGSGCLPNAALAYLECEDCAGDGRKHAEHRLDGSTSPAVELAQLRERITDVSAAYLKSWQRTAGASTLDTDVAQMLRNLLAPRKSTTPAGLRAETQPTVTYDQQESK